MSPRTALLAQLGLIGLAGQAAAVPPADPPVERRERNPADREYDQPAQRPGAWLVLTIIVWDALLDHLTIPLGTAVTPEPGTGCGA